MYGPGYTATSYKTQRNFPAVTGGRGGAGGKSNRTGGGGGLGEAPRMAVEYAQYFSAVNGGDGGEGGFGANQGGLGGIGQGPRFSQKLMHTDAAVRVRMPHLSVKDFCRSYGVSATICKLLSDQGFETAGSLLETDDYTLSDIGFKQGQIAELKRALGQFVAYASASTSSRK
ncbi:hypothetical protein R3P38DRAFT_2844945 [Favolaschia claudopus]|uniref:SAM domain-containing protein n=1 Tax=Favolaschia claudopus TaxID=2862362 RepID=A0AAW0DS79_9AGAR